MIAHIWTVLCSRSIIDTDTRTISLIEVLEQVQIERPQLSNMDTITIALNFEVVSLWGREGEEESAQGRARVVLYSPSRVMIGQPVEYLIDLSHAPRTRTRVRGQGLQVREAGRYQFIVELQQNGETEWQNVSRLPLDIIFTSPESRPSES